jgi:PAS domain S-box-containing protein
MGGRPRRTVSVGVARFDARGRCSFANEGLEKVLGVTREQFLGDGWQHLSPDVASRIPERWDELRAGRSVVGVESYERSDGRRVSVQIESLPELDADGRVVSVVLTLVDLGEHEPVEREASRERERTAARLEQLECIYANAPVGLALIDRDLRYVRVNQAIADMNGLSIDQVVGKRYRDLAPETADLAEPFLSRVARRGQSVRNVEVRTRPPADPEHEHIYLMSLHPMRDAAGGTVGLISAVQDVTELRRAEERAARRLVELELVYANAPVGLCHVDAVDLHVRHLNARFGRLAGRPLDQQIGERLPDLLTGAIGRQLIPSLREVARSGMSALGVQVRGRPPGPVEREYTWIANLHPARRGGEVTEVIIVLQDVSALADRQRELEAVRDRLIEAQRVARVGSWEWDMLADEVWWSAALYEIFGEPRSYVPSYVGFVEHVHPVDRHHVRQQLDLTVRDGQPYHLTYRIIRGDGAERVLFTVARLERTPDGQPARLVGTCQDITRFGPPGRTSLRRLRRRPVPARAPGPDASS